ncbi:Type II secretion system protein D precursor [Pirellula sp. SH-Sr6A]|uniref:secretin N-terminal domain-containing protein n=1 Tax=Pirellula sp. SH-Sr6A TaxID=1632865 RepID=UPI00078B3335|nr:secretin N-terminal domain-containing protein [Pirellula sp. SH-Sr6A]AMV30943.1 Type II secretion system protein D precursor [Pirellula sp. SH-Sr6A]
MKKRFLLRFASYSVAILASATVVTRSTAQTNPSNRIAQTGAGAASNLPGANGVVASANSDGKLQIYDVPPETSGSLAAQLQLQYAAEKRIRISTEPGSGRLMVLAPEGVQQQIAQTIASIKSQSPTASGGAKLPPTIQQSNFRLQKINAKQLEDAINRLAGNKLNVVEVGNGVASLRLLTANGPQELMQIERNTNTVKLAGTPANVMAWNQVIAAIDLGQADPNRPTQIIPINPATPERIERAVQLVRFASYQQDGQPPQEDETGVAQLPGRGQNDQATVIGSPDALSSGTGLIGDVDISFVNEMGLVIVKGSKKDVERVLEVIEKIKNQSKETQPDIELVPLQHVNSQALSVIINDINTTVFAPRQGQVSITPLGQPNSLLLIGRKDAMTGLIDLITKLDQPLDPNSQLKVYKLLHTSSVDAELLIRNFFSETGTGATGGGGAAATTGLAPRIKVVADYRTNALIVQASPRDQTEVSKLIGEIDVETSPAESQIRVFPIKNAVASELQPILSTAISGQATGGTGGQGGGQGGGNQGGATSSRASTPSGKISISPREGKGPDIESGILAGVVITTSPSINALVVRAPAKSMPLVAALIEQLDQLPSADARIKVFPVMNGDATSLALTLQQVFGLPATAGTATTNAATVGLQNLAALTSGGDSSLIPLRVTTDARTNSIIASGSASDLEVIEALLYRLDDQSGQQRSNEVIWLRNSSANDVVTALNQLLNTQRQVITQQLISGQAISLFERVDREVFIVSEPATNSLIISATPRYLQQIRDVVTRLDRQQPMIAVEMLVAEVTLDDNFEMGNEFGIQDSLIFDRGSASGGTLGTPGFNTGTPLNNTVTRGRPQNVAGQGLTNFSLGRTNSQLGYGGLVLAAGSESVSILFRALQDANRVQVLSRPNLLTIDNNISVVQVGQSVPRIVGTTANQFGQQQNQITDTPVGLIMQIQPRTNQDGLINMIVAVNRSSLGNIDDGVPIGFGPNGEAILSPIINQTLAQTRVTAYDGQTVVLGGLISKLRSSRSRRIPWLASIPVAGALFRFESEAESRSELLIVMTPRVINSNDSAKIDMIKQVESSRMSWCMADILNIHGDVGLSPGNGLWGPAASPVIFPDLTPAVEFDPTMNPNVMMGEAEGVIMEEQPPVMLDPQTGRSILKDVPASNGNGAVTPAAPLQNTSYQLPQAGGMQPGAIAPASYQPMGPDARIASPTSR